MMMQAQEEMFDKLYLGPAFTWASKYGFALPLSYLVIADSFLHSGSMLDFLMNRFPEKKPSAGGDSKKWIAAYTNARKDWLANHSNRILRNTVYRCNCFLAQIDKNNWNLEETPVVMHGTPVNYA
jgi:chitosanase